MFDNHPTRFRQPLMSRQPLSWGLAVLGGMLLLSACQREGLQPLSAPTDSGLAGGGADVSLAAATPQPILPDASPTPANAVGAVLAEQTIALNAADNAPVALPFTGSTGQVIRVDLALSPPDAECDLRVIDKFGSVLAEASGRAGQPPPQVAELALPYDGTYRVEAAVLSGQASATVRVSQGGPASGGGSYGGLPIYASARLSSAGVYHVYQFDLAVGRTVTLSAVSADASPGVLDLRLFGPDGRLSAHSTEGMVSGYVAAESGIHTALIGLTRPGSVPYVFKVVQDDVPPTPVGPADVVLNQTYPVSLVEGSNLIVAFDGSRGETLRIAVFDMPRDLGVDLYLRSPFDQTIAFATGTPAEQETAIREIQLPYTGQYHLEMRPRGSGTAAFALTRLPAEALTGGGYFGEAATGRRSGAFTSGQIYHVYQFLLTRPAAVSLTLTSGPRLDAVMVLLSPDGRQIALRATDNRGDAQLEENLRQTGTYTVMVYSPSGATGAYEFAYLRR